MLVHHLRHGVAQQNDILVKGLNLPLQLDAIDQIDRYGHMLKAQLVQKWVLQELAFFVIHDIFSVLVIGLLRVAQELGTTSGISSFFVKKIVAFHKASMNKQVFSTANSRKPAANWAIFPAAWHKKPAAVDQIFRDPDTTHQMHLAAKE